MPSPHLTAALPILATIRSHVYGLTETYGPYTINVAPPDAPAAVRARQGVPNVVAGLLRVVDADGRDVPADGATMGEVWMRGNAVAKGYFDNVAANEESFAGGWFHSGDLAVVHPDGAIDLRDRKKDIIISGGENISTIEVERAVVSHPDVLECAVIAIPDEKWGEVPKAFVTLREGKSLGADELVAHCRTRLAAFKCPKIIEFGPLPKTSTGKIQKFVLRNREWAGREKRIN